MILDTTFRKLQAFLKNPVTTNQCSIVVDFIEFTQTNTTLDVQATLTNNTTPVEILSSPSINNRRKVNNISFNNIDSAPVLVTIQLNDNGINYDLISNLIVPVGSILQWSDINGWSMINVNGSEDLIQKGWVQTFTSNGVWVKPGNCRFFLVDVVGGGGGGGAGAGDSSLTFKNGGGGGGGGFRARRLFLAKDLPSFVNVTVAAQTSVALGAISAFGSNGSGGNLSSFGNFLIGYPGGGGAGGTFQAAAGNTGGGGGGGGTSAGQNNLLNSVATGGDAMLAGLTSVTFTSDSRGGPGANNGPGTCSYLGGAGGAAGYNSSSGGGSYFSAAAGGGGGTVEATNATASGGGSGGSTGGFATTTGGGGTAGSSSGGNGGTGNSVAGFCGQGGGGGGGALSVVGGIGGNGGDGGFPGGGGGAGGGGTVQGGNGGRGAAGMVRVMGW